MKTKPQGIRLRLSKKAMRQLRVRAKAMDCSESDVLNRAIIRHCANLLNSMPAVARK